MTTLAADPVRVRPHPWDPFLALLVQVGLLGIACTAADHSGIERPPSEWPYLFAFVFVTALVASWPAGLTVLTGIVGSASTDPATRRLAAMIGALVAAVSGVAGAAMGTVWLLSSNYASERLVATSLVLGGLVALLPARTAFRRTAPTS